MAAPNTPPRVLDPREMARRGKVGAHVLHSRHDPRETTAKGRATFLARFEREVDPERTLPEAERQRRAQHARAAYFARLALKSARTRAKRARRKAPEAVTPGAETTAEVRHGAAERPPL
jgi:hypothetical protein